MAFKAPKGTTWNAADDGMSVTLSAIDGGDDVIVNASYGLLTREDSGVVSGHRYVVSMVTTIMGKEVHLSAGGVDVNKALVAFIETELRGDADDYEIEGTDDEYFAQKFVKPKEDKADVWHADAYKDKIDALNTMRSDVENQLIAARDSETTTQADYLQLANTLVVVRDTIVSISGKAGLTKAMASWAAGDSEGGNSSMPLLTQLGTGANALREAMRLATLTDAEFAVLPAGITSGKGVERHLSVSVKSIVADANMNKMVSTLDVSGERATIEGVAAMIRHIAVEAFKIPEAGVDDDGGWMMLLDDIAGLVDERAATLAGEFMVTFGKNINTYNKVEFDAAKTAMGAVRVSSGGGALVKHAIETVNAYQALDDGDDAGREALMGGLFSKTGGNMLVKEAYADAKNHIEAVSADRAAAAATKAAIDAVASVGTGDAAVFSKTARSNFESLSAAGAAAELYALGTGHPDAAAVFAALESLISAAPKLAVAAE